MVYILNMHTFQSTLPTRGSDLPFNTGICLGGKFQSTLPTRGSDIIIYSIVK